MKIAVIGGGIFGATAAIKLKIAGHEVDLFEKYTDILQAASGINQYRFHRGYHYPRSAETAVSSVVAEPLFRAEYGAALIEDTEHYYVIAREGSKVSGQEFKIFCDKCNLEYQEVDLPLINKSSVDLTIKVKESIIDPNKLRAIVWDKLKQSKVRVFLNQLADGNILDDYDLVVNATYANLNFLFDQYPEAKRQYQFEVCEKLVLELPAEYKNKSIVVLDGPFMCIDPYNDSGFHVMGNVVYAIHTTNTGFFPEIPEQFLPLLNKGLIKNPVITNVEKFIESAKHFLVDMEKAKHIGSMFTVRTVLPNVDKTDERPTLVYRINDQVINIFSGKIGNSVQAAEQVVKMVNGDQ